MSFTNILSVQHHIESKKHICMLQKKNRKNNAMAKKKLFWNLAAENLIAFLFNPKILTKAAYYNHFWSWNNFDWFSENGIRLRPEWEEKKKLEVIEKLVILM